MKAYPSYKDSGVPWLGDVPEHWGIRRTKYILKEIDKRSSDGTEELLSVSQYTGVTPRKKKDNSDIVDSRASSLVGYKVVQHGDLVVNIMLAWNGSLGVSPYSGIVSPAYCIYRFSSEVLPKFYHYLFKTDLYKSTFKTYSTGVVDSRLRLYSDKLGRIESLIPSLDEQQQISRYLDWQTSKINKFIKAKKKLIALLKEQKQNIINEAVTKGINPDVEMKDIENRWYTQIPVKWNLVTLGRVINSAVDGPHFSPNYYDSGIPFLSARNVKVDRWSLEDAKYISSDDYEAFCKRVKPCIGDVLYTKGGTTGVARAVDLDFEFQVWVHIAVLKVKKELIHPNYLAICLNSPICYEQSQLLTRGATNQDLGLGRMKTIFLLLPPLSEQQSLVDYINQETALIDKTIARTEREIELIQEYRTRLVSDVVTGKVDVRSVEIPDFEPIEADLESQEGDVFEEDLLTEEEAFD